jgi:hypothetical protein
MDLSTLGIEENTQTKKIDKKMKKTLVLLKKKFNEIQLIRARYIELVRELYLAAGCPVEIIDKAINKLKNSDQLTEKNI